MSTDMSTDRLEEDEAFEAAGWRDIFFPKPGGGYWELWRHNDFPELGITPLDEEWAVVAGNTHMILTRFDDQENAMKFVAGAAKMTDWTIAGPGPGWEWPEGLGKRLHQLALAITAEHEGYA
jgi:hypothetical protein